MTTTKLFAPLLALTIAMSAAPAMAQSAQPNPGATITANPLQILIGFLLPAPQLPRDAARR